LPRRLVMVCASTPYLDGPCFLYRCTFGSACSQALVKQQIKRMYRSSVIGKEDMRTQPYHGESKNNPHQRLQHMPNERKERNRISMGNCTTEELPVPAFSFHYLIPRRKKKGG
jgi:hypothetical protein